MQASRRWSLSIGWIAIGWSAFFVLWMLFILGYAEGNLAAALRSSAVATLLGASATPPIWWYSGRRPWPDGMETGFVLRHAGLALVCAVYWATLNPILEFILMGEPPSAIDWLVPVTGWRLLGGVWIYLIIAGLAHAARNNARLRLEERRAARAETEAARARLEALRARIQPHFLLNALHGIASLVESDLEAAQEALERLGDLLRYAVRMRESEFVPLRDEWDFVLGYLELQTVRFRERLRVEAHMEPRLGSAEIPVFSLQPLVENAVLHGIETRPGGGTIRIRAERSSSEDDSRIRLSVCDDGPGTARDVDSAGMGTGLDSLSDRLNGLYGEVFSLEISRTPSGGTCAVIEVPI